MTLKAIKWQATKHVVMSTKLESFVHSCITIKRESIYSSGKCGNNTCVGFIHPLKKEWKLSELGCSWICSSFFRPFRVWLMHGRKGHNALESSGFWPRLFRVSCGHFRSSCTESMFNTESVNTQKLLWSFPGLIESLPYPYARDLLVALPDAISLQYFPYFSMRIGSLEYLSIFNAILTIHVMVWWLHQWNLISRCNIPIKILLLMWLEWRLILALTIYTYTAISYWLICFLLTTAAFLRTTIRPLTIWLFKSPIFIMLERLWLLLQEGKSFYLKEVHKRRWKNSTNFRCITD